jgi:hypothetical protein
MCVYVVRSFVTEIFVTGNSTIVLQVVDWYHWPFPAWSPSDLATVYYVDPAAPILSETCAAASWSCAPLA